MSRQANATVIGGFVLGALGLTVAAIILFGGGALLRDRVPLVTWFPGSVQGLSVGAPVQFQGVTVGRVTAIELSYSAVDSRFSIPVSYEVWPERVQILGMAPNESARDILDRLVQERGLHARLESQSFVTGQYLIALSLMPGRQSPLMGNAEGAVEVPALEATRDLVVEMLGNLRFDALIDEATRTLVAVRQLVGSDEALNLLENLDTTLAEARDLLKRLDSQIAPLTTRAETALSDYAALAVEVRTLAGPLLQRLETTGAALEATARQVETRMPALSDAATRTFATANNTLRSVDTLVTAADDTRLRLDRLLNESSQAARAVRDLADYLERNPEALLRGKH